MKMEQWRSVNCRGRVAAMAGLLNCSGGAALRCGIGDGAGLIDAGLDLWRRQRVTGRAATMGFGFRNWLVAVEMMNLVVIVLIIVLVV
ncbi:hypothetical protein M0R45_006398 [Rubus argutus]|uniref:Uncharacterized protein n=1 Tax=Rubus argutus TaxID=59490 RepID=A0AAW1YQR5_RUBAR